PHVPENVLLVSESGISAADDVRGLMADGVPAFLVGESLMRQNDITAATRTLLGISTNQNRFLTK
ncbi:MAG: indole-3-glycerol-phosphate synthase TrpC, partial [Pseudomonadota bacterium]|nr:indole-3-glycerol-phosphate synthase TrpC [Pseudomonadota bacterium]